MAHRRLDFSRAGSASEEEEEGVRTEQEKEADDDKGDAESDSDHGDDVADSHSHLKRPAEWDADHSKKKLKKLKSDHGGGGEGSTEKKPPPFTRIFSEKDEILILKGMLKFHGTSDSAHFLEFAKKKLSVDVSETQLKEKGRRLKDKYSKNLKKGKDETDFSNPHDIKLFKLCKNFWGDLGLAGNSDLMKISAEDKKVVVREFSDLYPFLNLSLNVDNLSTALMSKDGAAAMESRLVLMDKSKLDELEKEWKNQFLDEAQVMLGRVALLQKQVKLLS